MPMILEIVIAMLACARIGVVHSIVVSLKKTVYTIILFKFVVGLYAKMYDVT